MILCTKDAPAGRRTHAQRAIQQDGENERGGEGERERGREREGEREGGRERGREVERERRREGERERGGERGQCQWCRSKQRTASKGR